MTKPFILGIAPNGARLTKAHHPALPMTIPELVQEAKRSVKLGVSLFHLHVRDPGGQHTLEPSIYKAAINAIRDSVGDQLIIQATTESADMYDLTAQLRLLDGIRPDSFSIAVKEICETDATKSFYKSVNGNTRNSAGAVLRGIGPSQQANLLTRIDQLPLQTYQGLFNSDILVQHIVYDQRDAERVIAWSNADLLPPAPPFLLLVLGRRHQPGKERDFLDFMQTLKGVDMPWAVCCFGPWEEEAVVAASEYGGHARVGFENNLGVRGAIAASNIELLERYVPLIKATGRQLATATDIRRQFGLNASPHRVL